MDRRTFLCGVTLGPLAAPLVAEAQQAAMVYRIGYIGITRPATYPDPSRTWMAFLHGLQERGWAEGQNIVIERRYTGGNHDRAVEYAGELFALKVDVMLALVGNPNAEAEAARTLPIVFVGLTDPVASGLVDSLARPGGHVTGLSNAGIDLNPKRLELLKAAVPGVARVESSGTLCIACTRRCEATWKRRGGRSD
jgi:putative ABC transport system substrate-binding protein